MPGVKKHYAQLDQGEHAEPKTIPLINISPTVQRRTSFSFLVDAPSFNGAASHLLEPKVLKRSSSAPPIESDDLELTEDQESPSLPPIFSCSSQYSPQDSSITIMRNTREQKKFYLLSTLSPQEQIALHNAHPLLAKRILGPVIDTGMAQVFPLGQGTFSSVRLAKDEQGTFFAVRAILSKEELIQSIPNKSLPRGKVLFDTMTELEAHALLKAQNLHDAVLLTEDVAILKTIAGIQLYQFLPLANLGNGNSIINKMEFLNSAEKKQLFDYIALQLLQALEKIHAQNVAINDIKPANILFASTGAVSYSDLGAVSYLDAQHKLKCASPLKDQRYLAPYLPLAENASDSERLKQNQRGDLWSLALTLLEFWEQPMVTTFIDRVLTRYYSEPTPKIIAATTSLPGVGYYVTNPQSLGVTTSTAIEQVPSTPKPREQKTLEELQHIYQEELETFLFASASFAALPLSYQILFKAMLNLEPGPNNMTITLASLRNEQSGLSISAATITPLFAKFLTIPDDKFNAELLKHIIQKISELLSRLEGSTLVRNQIIHNLTAYTPGDFAKFVLPLMQNLRFETVEQSDLDTNRFFSMRSNKRPYEEQSIIQEAFVNLIDKFCKGELPYYAVFNELTDLLYSLDNRKNISP
jgi:serine/threonine protein kinase